MICMKTTHRDANAIFCNQDLSSFASCDIQMHSQMQILYLVPEDDVQAMAWIGQEADDVICSSDICAFLSLTSTPPPM